MAGPTRLVGSRETFRSSETGMGPGRPSSGSFVRASIGSLMRMAMGPLTGQERDRTSRLPLAGLPVISQLSEIGMETAGPK